MGDILVENTSNHNLVPSAMLTFTFKDKESMFYELNPSNMSILNNSNSQRLISMISDCQSIESQFEIESYSFINDVRNLWRWSIDYKLVFSASSQRMLASMDLDYERMGTS